MYRITNTLSFPSLLCICMCVKTFVFVFCDKFSHKQKYQKFKKIKKSQKNYKKIQKKCKKNTKINIKASKKKQIQQNCNLSNEFKVLCHCIFRLSNKLFDASNHTLAIVCLPYKISQDLRNIDRLLNAISRGFRAINITLASGNSCNNSSMHHVKEGDFATIWVLPLSNKSNKKQKNKTNY